MDLKELEGLKRDLIKFHEEHDLELSPKEQQAMSTVRVVITDMIWGLKESEE